MSDKPGEPEEELMEMHRFPGLPHHKRIHIGMMRKTYYFRKQELKHEESLDTEALSFLKNRWLNHIRVMDAEYKPFLKEKKA